MAKQTKNAGVVGKDPDFDWGAPEEFDQGMGNPLTGSGIELPFFTPFLSWFNGNTAYKKHGVLATYTGGWSMWQEAADELEASVGHVNNCFELAEGMADKDGNEYSAQLAQWLPCAILGERTRWVTKKDSDKKSSHTQVLVYTADPMFSSKGDVEFLSPYAPMVLTVKGWQSDYLKKAIKLWIAQTQKARSEAGKGKALHPSLFYMMLGVYGNERQLAPVGSGESQKSITPIQAIVPDVEAGASALRMFYTGRETAQLLLDLKNQAKEWLNDQKWKSASTDDVRGGSPNEPEAAPVGEDDFPF